MAPGVVEKQSLPQITVHDASGFVSGVDELDRVLGGSLLPGMTVLIGGDPGIGKSTLVLQAADAYSKAGLKTLYVTGEESMAQIKTRADRLGVRGDNIVALNATALEQIVDQIESERPSIVILDSIQTTASGMFDSPPGTVAQVRETANRLITLAKATGFSLFLVGHVTKDGMVAGPKVLEHMVDTVLYFEGDSTQLYRMLRATKNRFGSIAEIGIFEMQKQGLVEVANPSQLFLPDDVALSRSGSVITALCEGNRPIMVEVQALVTSASYGTPQRVAGGIDGKRLALLLAILEKRCGYPMAQNDVFVSVAGGLRLSEPALDLPILTAIASSLLNKTVDRDSVIVGEVGLSSEVRGVTLIERRINESSRMGFTKIIGPDANRTQFGKTDAEYIPIRDLQAALDVLLV
jgi:DNA repair protein RadA/Sms